ncbi:MAG TPA: M20/M25/M40 family metallo-hydrolase [Acidobacteriaceae bacterium]|nr:M20/M25/M40 family metallo-hydrolase [Acidobacteriaceae bacterium]
MMEDACGSRVDTCTKLSTGFRGRLWAGALPGVCVLAVVLVGAPAWSQQPSAGSAVPVSAETHAALQQLIGNSLLDGQAYEYDRQLADMIGPRLTGSTNYMHAAEWAEQQFKSLGLKNVHTEEWTIPATWEPEGPAAGRIVSPVDHHLHIYSAGWSPSTPKDGVKGEVVYVKSIAPADLDAQKAKLHGAIALLDDASLGEKPRIDEIVAGIERLRSFSPTAILISGGENGTETMTSLNFSGAIDSLPEAQIGAEDTSLMKRLLEHGPVTVEFSFTNRIRKAVKVPNVIAEMPGRETPDEVVIVGAHLDSWQPGTGAQDNGTGAASVIEAARAIQSLRRAPRRTLRFILFGGEEEGLLGSTAYVRQHMADLPKIDAVLITDSGSQPAKGWYMMGREDEKAAIDSLSPVLAGMGADGTNSDTQFLFQTDHAAFDVLGVPELVLWNDTDKYSKLHHKASDTFDSVVRGDLTQDAAVTAVTTYAIADSSQPFAAHLSTEEVRTMLKKKDNLEEYDFLKKMGSLP